MLEVGKLLQRSRTEIIQEAKRFVLVRGKGERKKFLLPRTIDLNKLAWALGLLEGDRTGNIMKSVGISSNSLLVAQKFIDQLDTGLGIPPRFLVMNINTAEEINKNEITKNLGIPIEKIFVTKVERIRKPLFQPILFSRTIATLFENLQKTIENAWQEDLKLGSQFAQGFCDAEASIHKRDKAIEIRQKRTRKGKKNIKHIAEILSQFQIKNSIEGPNCENMLILRIWGGKRNSNNVLKFKKHIGFSHPEKLMSLEMILNELFPA